MTIWKLYPDILTSSLFPRMKVELIFGWMVFR